MIIDSGKNMNLRKFTAESGVCITDITLLKAVVQKNVILVLSSDYYNENCQFRADFSTIAYVFVFSIVTTHIGRCLFPSINPIVNGKKHN
jgi:hypothetical protein